MEFGTEQNREKERNLLENQTQRREESMIKKEITRKKV